MINNPRYQIHIGPESTGRTIKSILLSDAKMSRRMIRHLAQTNQVLSNGKPVFLSERVAIGDEIYVMLPQEQSEVNPEPMELDIRYEDEEFIVINKAPGILTHPTARERTGSLLAGVRAHLGVDLVPHCVHRLDRDTSGLVIFAKHAHAHQLLDRALRQGQVHRVYHAIATRFDDLPAAPEGVPPGQPGLLPERGWPEKWITIDLPIAQDPDRPSRRIIHTTGQRAVTHYRVIEQHNGLALLQIVLETGRTHQIRLHMAAIGHPLLGDADYNLNASMADAIPFRGDRGKQETMAEAIADGGLRRHALHAAQVGWHHPVTGHLQVVAAEPPFDMQTAWVRLTDHPIIWSQLANDLSGLQRVEMLS